jgi:hypothetical protein
MIIKETKHEEVISDEEGLSASVSLSALPAMFTILSQGFYSRPIDSIVRELTSNCFDSHAEAKTNEPVIIENRVDLENDIYNIVFKDVGVGLSPDRIENIYMKWFSSTKRDTNEFIGGFGLGSKSPFSYTDSFFITTWHEGLKYEYVFSKSTGLPQLISLYGYNEIEITDETSKEEQKFIGITKFKKLPAGVPSNEQNGTEVIIPLKNKADLLSFINSIEQELCYFDNVYCKGFSSINNSYSIYKKKSFIYRPDNQYSSNLHLVLGKVSYPIDFMNLGIAPINLPFGLTFEIGEFQVTPNREQVIYSEETVQLIKNKIEVFLKEIQSLVTLGGIVEETDDIEYFIDNRNKKPSISFDENKVFIPVELLESKPVLIFSPLKDLPIVIPQNPFFFIESPGYIENEKFIISSSFNVNYKQSFIKHFIFKDIPFNKDNNLYISTIKGNCTRIYKKNKLNKHNYKEYCDSLKLYIYKKPNSWQLSNNLRPKNADDSYTYIKTKEGYKREELVLNKVSIVKKYIDIMYNYLQERSRNYSDFTPTSKWLEEYKLKRKLESAAYTRKLNKEVIIKENGARRSVKLQDLSNCDVLIYCLPEEVNKLNKAKNKLVCIKSMVHKKYTNKTIFKNVKNSSTPVKINVYKTEGQLKQKYRFIEVAKTNLPLLKDIPQLNHVDLLLKSELFKKYDTLKATYEYIRGFWWFDNKYINKCDYYRNFISKVKKETYNKFLHYNEYSLPLFTNKDKDLVEEIQEIDRKLSNLNILSYLIYLTPDSIIKQLTIKSKVLKLNSKWYGNNPVIKKEPVKEIFETIII